MTIALTATILAVTALAAWWLLRDTRRAVTRRAHHRAFRRLGRAAGVAGMAAAAGPALGKAAAAASEFEDAMRRVTVDININTSDFQRKLQALARSASQGGLR